MEKKILFGLAFAFMSTANAFFCYPGYHYSDNYSSEMVCEVYRFKDYLLGKTYNNGCYRGLFFYYYCKKDD